MKFNNLAELKNIAITLDKAEEREVWISQKNNLNVLNQAEKHKGIWNISKNHLSCIGSQKYKLIPHTEALEQLLEVMTGLGLSATGIVKDFGDKVVAEILFADKEISDGEQGIKVGVRIVNSYDMSHSLSGELFAYRMICSNGMSLGIVFKDVSFRRIHFGIVDVRKQMRNFLIKAIEHETELQKLVSKAMKTSIEWDIAEKLLEKLIYQDKYRKKILEQLDKKKLTRWEVYNAITNLATNGQELKESIRDYLQRQAQKVLVNEIVIK